MNEMLPKKKKILMNNLFYLDIILLRKSQLVTSYNLKRDVNRSSCQSYNDTCPFF